jgi:hypothetical protein
MLLMGSLAGLSFLAPFCSLPLMCLSALLSFRLAKVILAASLMDGSGSDSLALLLISDGF